VWDSGDGLVCFDTSGAGSGRAVVSAIRGWSTEPFSHLVYTHGHVDHIGGSFAFAEDADTRGHAPANVVGHENVNVRIDRYTATNDWNIRVNQRQFGGIRSEMGLNIGENLQKFLPSRTLRAKQTFRDVLPMTIGDTKVEMHHARGETDDHLWAWLPDKKWLFAGDFVIWNYPNAGNPQKVQRYALEWAQALRRMIDQGPELLVPAHGLPIEGKARIAAVLDTIASSLETVVSQVLEMMNAGETLDSIIHTVKVPQEVLAKPFMRPLYDEPEFVVRNIWRLYGGWWDGAASRLKPSPDAVLANELASLAGGPDVLMRRALNLMNEGDLRLACHLADFAGWSAPDDPAIHTDRATIYEARRKAELSLMSKGIFKAAARESEEVANRKA
jgi:alkyl sulfatase BDS1-like metallo-beta-lactamase superfamily hydrolase